MHGEKIEELVIIDKIHQLKITAFDYVVCSIEESNDVNTLFVDELQINKK